ncbi:SCO family protein [Dokdonella sp.]|uniref:SCO family protein n=1 Tax=Dokdonella sp. TaxID=2291710 RepID=UPI0031C6997B|nr:SCO family protein [Dokdonella sp.]
MKFSHTAGRVSASWLIVITAFAAALGLWFGTRMFATPPAPNLEATLLYPAPRALPDFQLVRSDGTPFTQADWKGRWTVVFFGFTNCPDVCPNTLSTLRQTWATLGTQGLHDRVRIDFISVDPQRDTPAQLARYTAFFSPDFVAATGSDEELTRLTRALGLLYHREPAQDGHYSVDHSASLVVIDPQGRQAGLIKPPFDAARIARDLGTLAGGG